MIGRDRQLLARAATVNKHLGTVVSDMLEHQDGGELPACQLRQLGEALIQLGTDMVTRSTEIDGHLIETTPNKPILDTPDP